MSISKPSFQEGHNNTITNSGVDDAVTREPEENEHASGNDEPGSSNVSLAITKKQSFIADKLRNQLTVVSLGVLPAKKEGKEKKSLLSRQSLSKIGLNALFSKNKSGQAEAVPEPVPLEAASESQQSTAHLAHVPHTLIKIVNDVSAAQALETLRNEIELQGDHYRIDEQEKRLFIRALAVIFCSGTYREQCNQVERVINGEVFWEGQDMSGDGHRHPELKNIPMEELVALRLWTAGDMDLHELAKQAMSGQMLREDYIPPNVARHLFSDSIARRMSIMMPIVKAMISGLNALPASYNHRDTVFRGEQLNRADLAQFVLGQTIRPWKFMAAARNHEASYNTLNASFVITPVSVKKIEVLSINASEQETLFRPGYQYRIDRIERDEESWSSSVEHPKTRIYMTQLPGNVPIAQ